MDIRRRYKVLTSLMTVFILGTWFLTLWLMLTNVLRPILIPAFLLFSFIVISAVGLILPITQAKAGIFETITDGPVYEMTVDLLDKAGLKLDQVQIFIKPGKESNAAVNGYRGSYYIIINQSLLEALSSEELRAILAHEVAHIKNRDGIKRFFDFVLFLLLPYSLLAAAVLLPKQSFANDFLGIAGLISLVALFLRWLYRSRKGEYAADLLAAEILGDKGTLIQALTIINEKSRFKPDFLASRKPLLTHPDLNSRIANLRKA